MADRLEVAESKNTIGNTQYKLQQYHNAILYYTKAIENCPQIAKYYGNRSACYINLNDFVQALVDAKKATELDPGYLKGYTRIIQCYLASDDLKFAEKTVNTAKGIFPEDSQILDYCKIVADIQKNKQKYQHHFEKKKYEEALKFIENCIAKSPKCLSYVLKKAECLIYLEKYDEALQISTDILSRKSTNEEALYIHACSQFYQEDVNKTYALIQNLKRKLPDHQKTNHLFRSATLINKTSAEIEKALKNNDYQLAYKLTADSLKVDENNKVTNRRMHQKKIEICTKDKRLFWKGVSDCSAYLKLYGIDLKILKMRAQFNMDLQEFDDAVVNYEEIIKIEKNKENQAKLKKATEMFEDQIKCPHKLLKIPENCTKKEVKKAFTELIKHYHPDKCFNATPEEKKRMENKLIRLREAQAQLFQIAN